MRENKDDAQVSSKSEPLEGGDVFARLRDFARGRRSASGAQAVANGSVQAPQQNGESDAGFLQGLRWGVSSTEEQAPHGTCELCSLPLMEKHRHLFEVASSQIVCACDGCALTFQGLADGRYKPVPRDSRRTDRDLAAAIPWEQLSLPINLVFFVREGETGGVSAYYPSPGGVTKSSIPFDSLDEMLGENGVIGSLEPHVEALLVNRLTQKTEAFIVPIDLCYELTGRIRVNWRGFSGGEDVRREMNTFFDRIRSSARSSLSA